MRVDEFSMQKLRESHATIQELHCVNDSREFEDFGIDLQWKIISVNRQSFQVLDLWRAATEAYHLIHGICLGHRETLLAIHVTCSIHHRFLIKEFFTQRIKVPQVECQCREVKGDLSRELRTNWKHNSNAYVCREAVNHEFFLPTKIPQNSIADQQRLQMSELQFDKIPTPSTFSCWKIRFQTQVSSCSDFPSEAMLRIKEVEMIDSLDELKSSRSIKCKDFPNFEMLDARIASALNKVIQNSDFKKKVSLDKQKAQKEGRFLRGRQIAYMIYDCFRVTGAHDTVLDCAGLFSVTLRNDDVQDFDTRWDDILLSMTKIPSDEILESLYKLRIRESDQLKTVSGLYDMEIHQKISKPDYQILKTMVNKSIDQKLKL